MLKSYLTLKLTFSPRGSSKIVKILPEKDFLIKITRKRGITLVSSFICWKPYFRLPDLEIDTMTLKITFYHQNSNRNGLFGQITSKRRTTLLLLFVFAKNHIFTFLTLGFDFHMTLS